MRQLVRHLRTICRYGPAGRGGTALNTAPHGHVSPVLCRRPLKRLMPFWREVTAHACLQKCPSRVEK